MNHILHATRRASCTPGIALPRQLHRRPIRPISTTLHLSAVPAVGSSEDPVNRGSSASVLKGKESQSAKMKELIRKTFDAPYRKPPQAPPEEMERRYNLGRNCGVGTYIQFLINSPDRVLVVAENKKCWILSSGRIAKKATKGSSWVWAHEARSGVGRITMKEKNTS